MRQSNSEGCDADSASGERDRLLLEHMPQVKSIARRIHGRLPRHIPLEDLVHAGVLGLVDAFEKFDPSKHVEFSSYAKFRIQGAIIDNLRELDWSPRNLRRKARRLEHTQEQLANDLGRAPSEPELAAALGVPLQELQSLLAELNSLEIGSLQETTSRNGRNWEELCESVPDRPQETPFFMCLREEVKGLLKRLISELPEKEGRVLSLYYFQDLTMKEVGERMGIGESRVSQFHSMAMGRLRARLPEGI